MHAKMQWNARFVKQIEHLGALAAGLMALLGMLASGLPARAAVIDAVWLGGSGDYEDGTFWNFSEPPSTATYPDNGGGDFFRLHIDDGLLSTASVATLSTQASVDALMLDAGDALVIADSARLAFSSPDSGRPDSGSIENHGVLSLVGAASAPQLAASGSLSITGSGAIELGDELATRIGSATNDPIDLFHGEGHTIRGAGTIALNSPTPGIEGTLTNAGTIEATGARSLRILADLENDGVLLATGAGGLLFETDVTNRGTIEVRAGSRLVGPMRRILSNEGTLRVTGQGATAGMLILENAGLTEVLDGARLQIQTSYTHERTESVTRVAGGGSLILGDRLFRLNRGRLVLDDGVLTSAGVIKVYSAGRLEGNGSIRFPSNGELEISPGGVVSPGLDGAGWIDVVGNIDLGGRLEIELGGADPLLYDRITASQTARLYSGGTVGIALTDSYAPRTGDLFEILTAGSIEDRTTGLTSLFEVPALPDGLVFVPDVLIGASTQSLALSVAEIIQATWEGGTGAYSDGGRWQYSSPPLHATYPDNDLASIFDVHIDGDRTGVASQVSLDTDATIGLLSVDAGDTLLLGDATSLTLATVLGRETNGVISNDGTLSLHGDGTGAALLAGGDLEISGAGEIVLSDSAHNAIRAAGASSIDVLHGEDHTLHGAGVIDLRASSSSATGTLTNAGTIEATELTPLTIEAVLVNEGTLLATGSGGLAFESYVTNRGIIEVGEGSRAMGGSSTVTNTGTLRLSGVGSTGEFRLSNTGLVDVVDGAALSITGAYSQGSSATAVTRVADGGTLELSSSGGTISRGSLLLDAGTVSSESRLTLRSSGRLEGNGALVLTNSSSSLRELDVRSGGVVAPGIDGIGTLEILGILDLSGGRLEMDLAGTGAAEADRISVSESAALAAGSEIEIALLEGFTPSAGNLFEILSATSIAHADDGLKALFDAPPIADDLYFVPEVVAGALGESLALHVAQLVEASWRGGSGTYTDEAKWSFSAPPQSATFPTNDTANLFDVRIDGGDAGAASNVALGAAVEIGNLYVGAGDTLSIGTGGVLDITSILGREVNGIVANDGSIVFDGAGGALRSDGDLEIAGAGVITLGGGGSARIASTGTTPIDLRHAADHTLRGAGTIDLNGAGTLGNEGMIEGTEADPLVIDAEVDNLGLLRATGSGGIEIEGDLTNYATLEIGAGSRATIGGRFSQRSGGVTSVAEDGVLAVSNPYNYITGGRVLLDGGTVSSLGELVVQSWGRLEGNGSIEFGLNAPSWSRMVSVDGGGALAPGLDGVGSLNIFGDLFLTGGRIEIELGDPAADHYDRIWVEERARLSGSIDVTTLASYAPSAGDRFDIVTMGSLIYSSGDVHGLFDAPELPAGFFFDPGLAVAASREQLYLRVLQLVDATWDGGSGSFTDATRWSFDPAPISASHPNNDAFNLFDVHIDGGAALGPSSVTLGTDVAIGTLSVDRGNSLSIGNGASLTLASVLNRDANGFVANDGTIALDGAGAGAALYAEGDVRLTGSGLLVLSDYAENYIGSGNERNWIAIEHGAEHTLRGAGTIDGELFNAGTIEATGANALVIARNSTNEGTMRAIGAGGLVFGQFAQNNGSIEVGPGSHIAGSSFYNYGTLQLSGAGATGQLHFTNRGLTSVEDGAVLATHYYHGSSAAVLRVADGGILEVLSLSIPISLGRVVIDDAVIRSNRDFLVSGSARFEGSGLIDMISLSGFSRDFEISSGAVLAPGIDGPGALTIAGDFELLGGVLEIDIGGRDSWQYDQIHVSNSALLESGSSIQLSLPQGFTLESGDRFDILTSAGFTLPGEQLSHLFTSTPVEGDFFLAPRIVTEDEREVLALGTRQRVDAWWAGGVGSYTDAASWSFGVPPANAGFPNNDDANLFDVHIDGGGGAAGSDVLLDAAVAIDTLFVDEGDRLALAQGASLTLADTLGRAETGRIANDGEIAILAGGLPTGIFADGNLEITGTGAIALGDDPAAVLGASVSGRPTTLTHAEGHTIRGAGSIAATEMHNLGTIEADGVHALAFAGALLNDGTLRATGSGGIQFAEEVTNRGLVEVVAGGRIQGPGPDWPNRFTNEGVLRVTGEQSTAQLALNNMAFAEVSDGAKLILERHSFQHGDEAVAYIARGGELVLPHTFGSISAGKLILDEGVLTAPGGVRFAESARLEGNGSVNLTDASGLARDLNIANGATLAPGLDDIGRLDVVGGLSFGDYWSWGYEDPATLEIELGGTAPQRADLVTASEAATFFSGSRLALAVLGELTLAVGDRFELVRAAEVTVDGVLSELFVAPDLGGEVVFVPEIVSGAEHQSLELGVADIVEARWNGGRTAGPAGSMWRADGPPIWDAFPSNDVTRVFDVYIDGGQRGVDSTVTLDGAAWIDSLFVDAGDSLAVTGGGRLTLADSLGRAATGRIRNDGTVSISSTDSAAELLIAGDLEISGAGAIEMTDDANNRIGLADGYQGGLTHAAGHTIRGAGTIDLTSSGAAGTLLNEGAIEATGANPLYLVGDVFNGGALRATGIGGLVVGGDLSNSGDIEVTNGSRFAGSVYGWVSNAGGISLTGPEASGNLGWVDNTGTIQILDGAKLEVARSYEQRGDMALTRVANGGELKLGLRGGGPPADGRFGGGRLVLEDGTVTFEEVPDPRWPAGLYMYGSARLEGNGSIAGEMTAMDAVIAPGLEGAGRLEIAGDLDVFGTTFEIELGGTAPETEYDLIAVRGTSFLDATLLVELIDASGGSGDPFEPTQGDQFDILLASEIIDEGFDFVLPDLAGGNSWSTGIVAVAGGQALRLRVIPEPSTSLLVLIGLVGLAVRRRQR